MALFFAVCTDKPDSLALRTDLRAAHLDFLKGAADRIKLGGPFMDDDGDMAGSLLVVEADGKAEAEALLAKDPYALAGLFQSVVVRPWRWAVGAPAA